MMRKCEINQCYEVPIVICNCKKETTFLCDGHIQSHILNGVSKFHAIKPLMKQINKESKPLIVDYLIKTLKKLENLKENVDDSISRLFNQFLNVSQISANFFANRINIVKTFYREIMTTQQISSVLHTDAFEINLEMIKQEIKNLMKPFSQSQLSLNLKILENSVKDLQKIIRSKRKIESLEENLYFFETNTTNLIEFNPEKFVIEKNTISLNENQGFAQAICNVSKDKIFVYGGHPRDYLKSCFLIHLPTKFVEKLENGIKRAYTSPVFFKNSVYLFGGYNSAKLIKCNAFDLQTKTWRDLANFPVYNCYTQSVVIENSFLITSCSSKIFKYFIDKNEYSVAFVGLAISDFHTMIKYKEKIYILGNSLYCTDQKNICFWKLPNNSYNFGYTTSKCVIRNNFAYFYDVKGQVYSFNFDTFELSPYISLV